jgi:hypothetical protein
MIVSFLDSQGGPYSPVLQGPFTQLSSCVAAESLPELGHDFRALFLSLSPSLSIASFRADGAGDQ